MASYKFNNKPDIRNRRCIIAGLFSAKDKAIEEHFREVSSVIEEHGGIIVGTLSQRRGVSRARKPGGAKKLDTPICASIV